MFLWWWREQRVKKKCRVAGDLRRYDVHCEVIVMPDDGLSPARHQTIIWTNVGFLKKDKDCVYMACCQLDPLEQFAVKFGSKSDWNRNISIHENWFENLVCKMASILSRPQYVKILKVSTVRPCKNAVQYITKKKSSGYFFGIWQYKVLISL